jgi:hypothetical protein
VVAIGAVAAGSAAAFITGVVFAFEAATVGVEATGSTGLTPSREGMKPGELAAPAPEVPVAGTQSDQEFGPTFESVVGIGAA